MQCNFFHEGRTKSMSFLWNGLRVSNVTTMQGLKTSYNVTLCRLILTWYFLYRASSSQITCNKDFESSQFQLARLGTFSSINSTSGSDRNVSSSKRKSGGKCGKTLLNTTSQVTDWPPYGIINLKRSPQLDFSIVGLPDWTLSIFKFPAHIPRNKGNHPLHCSNSNTLENFWINTELQSN